MQLLDIVTKNSTDRSVTIRICDSTDGTPETGVEHNTAGIDLWYRREGAAKVSITEAALSALTDAHSDGGIEHIGDGYYRLDLPDAAFATGANYVDIGGTVTDMIVFGGRVRLVDYSLEDSVRMGLSALPNAAAGAAGGLPTDSAGKTSFNDIAATAIVSGGAITTSGGSVSSVTTVTGNVSGSVGSVTGNVGGSVVGSVASVTGAVGSVTGNVGGNVTGSVGSLGAQAKLDVNAEVDTALSDYDAPTNTEMVAAFTEIKGATWSSSTDTLEAIRDRGDAAWTTATGFSTLDAAGVRTAVGLAAANLDTQLGNIPTVAEFEARTLPAANYFDPAADTVANVTTVGTVNALAANAVNANALATDAVAEIQSGLATSSAISALNDLSAAQVATAVWNAATADYGTAGTYGELLETNLDAAVSTAGGDSAATIWSYATRVLTAATNISGPVADAVWDEAASGHTTAGTTGKALTDAGSAGDPWSTSLPGAYGAGTAGYLVGTYIDAAISDAATAASVSALNDLSTADIDARLAAYDAPTNAEMVAAFTEIKGATWSSATDTLEAIRNRGDVAWTTATGFSTHSAADVWSVATRVLTAATNITSDGSAITMSSSGVVGTVNLVNTTTTNTDMRGTDGANTTVPPSVSAISTQVAADLATAHGAGSWATATGFAVAGDAMTLTVAYDAAKTAAQAGDAMTLAANSITASVLATDCITSGKIATDAIGASELSTAAINAIQSGLATAANQATLLSNQTAIAGYIDTEVAAIKAVTDKLDTTLVLDGAVYDFTAAALAAAPSGGGGGGDATADNQTIIIAHLTDIKGATWDSSNSLEAIHDDLATVDGLVDSILEDTGTTLPAAISAINMGAGSGARTVTVTVNDGSNPLQGATVRLTEGVNTYTASTNASGQATFNVDDATYTVAITKDGYTYAGTSLVITADATPTYSMTAVAITAAPSGYTTGYLYSYDADGDVEASISYRYRPVSPNAAATGESLSPDWNSVTSDVNGLVEFPKMRLGVTYEYQRVGNERQVGKFKVPTDASSTTALPQII